MKANRSTVIRIVIIYALFSMAWILLSDMAIGLLIRDTATLIEISVVKGFLFVIVTAVFLYQLIAREITKRQQVEQNSRASEDENLARHQLTETALQVSEQRLKLAAAAGHLGVWDRDLLSNRLYWDDRMFEIYGISKDSFQGTFDSWKKCVHPEDQERVITEIEAFIQGEKEYETEFRIPYPNGAVKYIRTNGLVIRDAAGKAIRAIGINQDITEQKTLEWKLQQAQKMESVGRLAGGVAHDFNNILTAIIGYGNILTFRLPADDPLQRYADQIIAASERAASLTRSMLAFSRQQIINPAPLDINRSVMDMHNILERIIGEDIKFDVKTTDRALIVKADKSQIEQILMNLATNARDAMPHGGTLLITTEESEIDERFIQAHQYGRRGRYAVITVSDTGTGMDKTTKEHIFEPFFTTKEVGKGTGLGLAMVYGTVKQHDGFINVYSEPDMGTTLRIYLPLADTVAPQDRETVATAPLPACGETLLLVEDDDAVMKATTAILEGLGYKIVTATNGKQAIERFSENKDRIHLVISDMIMPGMSRQSMHDELKKIKPDIKILYMSGYATDMIGREVGVNEDLNFIAKPFGPDALSKKIRQILNTGA